MIFLRPVLAAALAGLLAGAVSPARADDEPVPEGEAGTAIGVDDAQEASGAGVGQDPEGRKPAKRSGGSSSSGGGGGGGFVPHSAASAAAVKAAAKGGEAAAIPPDLGPDTPARHRPTTVPLVAPEDTGSNSHETFNPYRSVSNAESCYSAAKIFDLWQLWHFRRMNRVADNASGCPNVPVLEQAKIVLIQAKNAEASRAMSKLADQRVGDHGPYDDHCDEIIKIYRDTLAWSNLSMFFKGRYMTRCAPASTLGADWWPRACPDGADGKPVPRPLCSPPLPKS